MGAVSGRWVTKMVGSVEVFFGCFSFLQRGSKESTERERGGAGGSGWRREKV